MKTVILYQDKLFRNANSLIEYLKLSKDKLPYWRTRITLRSKSIEGYNVFYVDVDESIYNLLKEKQYIDYNTLKALKDLIITEVIKKI